MTENKCHTNISPLVYKFSRKQINPGHIAVETCPVDVHSSTSCINVAIAEQSYYHREFWLLSRITIGHGWSQGNIWGKISRSGARGMWRSMGDGGKLAPILCSHLDLAGASVPWGVSCYIMHHSYIQMTSATSPWHAVPVLGVSVWMGLDVDVIPFDLIRALMVYMCVPSLGNPSSTHLQVLLLLSEQRACMYPVSFKCGVVEWEGKTE